MLKFPSASILYCHGRSLEEADTIIGSFDTSLPCAFCRSKWEALQNPQVLGPQIDHIYVDYSSHFPWGLLFK